MDKRYIITMIAQTSLDEHPRLYALGFTTLDGEMTPVLCSYDGNTVQKFANIDLAKRVWSNYKNKLFKTYGNNIQKHNIFISELKMTVDKVEDLGER
jgi:hypothetical protein